MPGTLEMLILKTVSLGAMHGYAIADYIERTASQMLRVEEGALYPALHRIEARGWVATEWGFSENKRRAKFYRLTESGEKQLESEAARWKTKIEAVERIMHTLES